MTALAIPNTVERPRDVALDYLKTTIVLMVVAHHSCLAYTTFFTSPVPGVPVIDTNRWQPFNYVAAFNDVFFMSLMFFLSGLFVWPSLRRSGALSFMRDRGFRLGGPFAVGVVLLMPLAYYAAWQLTRRDAGFLDFSRQIIARNWPPGPLWFIWVLLFFDMLAAAFFLAWPGRMRGAPLTWTKRQALTAAAGMFVFCTILYLPALTAFGPYAWGAFFAPPFYFQLSRFGLYLIWFAVGTWLGSNDLEDGLLARDGTLAQQWPWWVAACVIAYGILIFLPMELATTKAVGSYWSGLIQALLWIGSCVMSCFAFLALFCGTVRSKHPWMDSMARSSYVIYLVHYVFVLWIQRALVDFDFHAIWKFLIVFLGALLFSWLTAQWLLRFAYLRRFL